MVPEGMGGNIAICHWIAVSECGLAVKNALLGKESQRLLEFLHMLAKGL